MTEMEAKRKMEDDWAAVQRAENESQRLHEALRESQRVRRELMPRLRKAGYIR